MKYPKISQIRIILIKPNNGLIGFASFVIDGWFYISSVGIYTRLDRLNSFRLVYPSKVVSYQQINIFYPINKLVGDKIEKAVSAELKKVYNQKSEEYDRYSSFDC